MLVYTVTWCHSPSLSKGKGRVRNNDSYFGFTVLCRNSRDAMSCLDWYFHNVYANPNGLDVSDGEVRLVRTSIDSRGFNVNYLLMDGIRMPVNMSDLKKSLSSLTINVY